MGTEGAQSGGHAPRFICGSGFRCRDEGGHAHTIGSGRAHDGRRSRSVVPSVLWRPDVRLTARQDFEEAPTSAADARVADAPHRGTLEARAAIDLEMETPMVGLEGTPAPPMRL